MKTPQTSMKRKPLITALTLSLVTVLSGCNSEAVVEEQAPVIRPVMTEQVRATQYSDLYFSGIVQSAHRADLAFRSSGRMVELLVKEGTKVEKGDLIARLDSADAQITLTSRKNEMDNARSELKRARSLYETRQAISKAQFEEIVLRTKLAENNYLDAQHRLDDTYLRAPFSGTVSRTLVDNFVMVSANETIVSLHDLDEMEVVINVPESVMSQQYVPSAIFATSPLQPDLHYPLVLKKYETEPDPITGTYAVTLKVKGQERFHLLPGMNVRVTTQLEEGSASKKSVPLTAVSPDNLGNQYVWVVGDNNRIEKRIVETGALEGERVMVRNNLEYGETYVVSGTANLTQGLEVRPLMAGAQ